MTRKDFNAIAAAIKATLDKNLDMGIYKDDSAILGIKEAAEAVANVCAESNSRFDRTRFLTACGVTGGAK